MNRIERNYDYYNALKEASKQKTKTNSPETYNATEQERQDQTGEQNVLVRSGATVLDLATAIGTGMFKFGEGIVDSLVYLGGAVGGVFDENVRKDAENFIAKDYTGETFAPVQKQLNEWGSYLDDNPVGQTIEQVGQGVGQILPNVLLSVATGGASNALTMGTLGVSAAGNSVEEAFNDGADYGKAGLYGAARGLTEVATEKMFGGATKNIYGKGALDKVVGKATGGALNKGLGKVVRNFAEEGIEEAVSELANPLAKSIYKGKDALAEYGTEDYWKGVGEQGLVGGLTGVVAGGTIGKINAKQTEIGENLQEIRKLENTAERMDANDTLSEEYDRRITNRIRDDYKQIEATLKSVNEEKRAKLIKQFNLSDVFDSDGGLNAEYTAERGLNVYDGQAVGNEGNGGVKTLASGSKYVSRRIRYSSQVTRDIEGLNESAKLKGIENPNVRVFDGELSDKGGANYTDTKSLVAKINRKTNNGINLVVIDSDAENIRGVTKRNTIYISKDALESGEGLRKTVHELIHVAQKGKTRQYKDLVNLLAEDEETTAKVIDSLTREGNGYGFTYETFEKIMEKGNTGERLTDIENEMLDEIGAWMGEAVLSDERIINRLVRDDTTFASNLINRIQDVSETLRSLKSPAAMKEYRRLKKTEAMYMQAIEAAGYKWSRGKIVGGDDKDETRGSYSSIAYTFFGDSDVSIKDMESGSYVKTEGYKKYVDSCLNNMRQSRGVDFDRASALKEIEDSIKGIVDVAVAMKKAGYDILDSEGKRSTRDSKKRLLFSSLEPNSDYFTSSDISTICDKRLNFAEIYDEIVRREVEMGVPAGKRFFSNADNYFVIHKIMAEKGLTQPCKQCYVESMRKNLLPMAEAFISMVKEKDVLNTSNKLLWAKAKDSDSIVVIGRDNKRYVKKVTNSEIRNNVLRTLEEHPEYGLTVDDFEVDMFATADGLADLKIKAPLIYEYFNSFYGQAKPKMPKEATPFRFGELTALLTDDNNKIRKGSVDKIKATGGFRLQSYSDFQIQNFVDVLQVIFEAGTLGLNGHAYTKVPAFLDATKDTNLKRNISIFMYKDGEEWKIDRNDSFPYSLEKIYDIVDSDESGNTSIIAVVQNEDMAAWIMANDKIGYFIPFHKSGIKMSTVRATIVKEGGREIKGYSNIKDHTRQQSEVWKYTTSNGKEGTKVSKPIDIYSFWDFSNEEGLSHNELIEKNVKRYIDECEKAGYLPKFREYVMNNSKVLSNVLAYAKKLGFVSPEATVNDISFKYKGYTIPYGYYKCLGDFGMFKPNGEASPIETLSLRNYDFEAAVDFFKNAESIRRTELLQQIANGEERERYITGDKKDMTTDQIAREIQSKRKAVVDQVVDRDTNFSLDSEGNTLTKAQQEFFRDSKVRDSKGRLLVVYHGSPSKFTEFSHSFMNTNGNAHGRGFYFTENVEYANGFKKDGGQLLKGYLDIRKPASETEVTIKKSELVKLIKATCEAQAQELIDEESYDNIDDALLDTWVSNYVNTYDAYSMDSVYRQVAESVFNSCDNDADIFAELTNGGAGTSRVLTLARKTIGYDGIIFDNGDGTHQFISFESNQFKNADNIKPTKKQDFRFSLHEVNPVEPTSDKWKRTYTTAEVKAKFPDLWDVSADESETRNPTQITGTVRSYRKVYDFLKNTGFNGNILDASSGLGYGTRAGIEEYGFNVDDIEPYPDKNYKPKYTDYSKLNKKYDVIISNAVLNVIPQDQRDALVVKMGELLKDGGRMFINVRGDDVKNASSKVAINEELMEYYISNTGSYQKGFTKAELVAYLQDALGKGYTVMPTTFFGKTSAVVTKDGGQIKNSKDIRESDYSNDSLDKTRFSMDGRKAKFVANNTRMKVYSKAESEEIINDILKNSLEFGDKYGDLSGKSKAEAADMLWKGLNSAKPGYQAEVALDVAEYIIQNSVIENIYDVAGNEKYMNDIAVLKPYLHRINLDGIREKIKHRYNGDNSPFMLWGKRKGESGLGADVIARELEELGFRIDAENEADIFFKIDETYREAVANMKKEAGIMLKSAITEEKVEQLKQEISKQVLLAYDENGQPSKLSRILDGYIKRTEQWKDKYLSATKVNRLLDLVQNIKNIKLGTFVNASEYKSDIFKNSIEKLANIKYRGELNKSGTRNIIKGLREWYVKENPLLENSYDEVIAEMLDSIANGKGKLDSVDIQALTKIVDYFTHFVKNFNKVYRNNKYVEALPIAEKYADNIEFVAKYRKPTGSIKLLFNKIADGILDPISVAKRADGYTKGFWTDTLDELQEGAITESRILLELNEPLEKFFKDNKSYYKRLEKETVKYKGVDMPVGKAISLCATYRRALARPALKESGFVIRDKTNDIMFEPSTPAEIIGLFRQLSVTDRQFLKLVKETMEKCKNLKRDTDMQLKGYSNVLDDYYYPIRRAFIAINIDTLSFEDLDSIMNFSFNKDTVKGAKGALCIDSVQDVLRRHISGIAKYCAYATVINNYNCLMNLNLGNNPNMPRSILSLSAQKGWRKGTDYFKKLFEDLKGKKSTDSVNKAMGFIRGSYAKFQLGANPKVWLTQGTSYVAAFSKLKLSSLVKGFGISGKDVDTYCELAKIRNSDNTAARAQGVLDSVGKVGDFLMKPIGKADRLIIQRLFAACQAEAASMGYALNTEENKVKAGEILKEVILGTQQNAMATERSAMMRHDSEFARAATMFSADAMKVFSRFVDGIGEVSTLHRRLSEMRKEGISKDEISKVEEQLKQAKRKCAKATSSLVGQASVMTLIAMLFKKLYNKDDDDDNFIVETVGNMAGGIPLLRDVYSFFADGYEVNNFFYDTVNSVLVNTGKVVNIAGDLANGREVSQQEFASAMKGMSYAVGQLFGLPVRNVYNVTYGLTNRFDESTAYKWDNVFRKKSFASDIGKAIEEDNLELASAIMNLWMNESGIGDNEKVSSELTNLYSEGFSVKPRNIGDSITYEGETYDLSATDKANFRKIYSQATEIADKLISNKLYEKADSEVRAKAIKYIYDLYYNLGVGSVLNVDMQKKSVLFGMAIPQEILAMVVAQASVLSADEEGTLKAKLQAYISSLNVSAAQKYMLMGYLGYKNKNGEAQVKSYINRLSLTKEQKESLFKMSGYDD